MSLTLTDEHLEILYVLLNEEQDPKYFFPHFQQSCDELVSHSFMRYHSRVTKKLKPQIEPLGLRAFLAHYSTHEVSKAMRAHVMRSGLTQAHMDLLGRLCTGNPISSTELYNEMTAYDLVNLGYLMNIFPSSGVVYYCKTHEGSLVFRQYQELALEPA